MPQSSLFAVLPRVLAHDARGRIAYEPGFVDAATARAFLEADGMDADAVAREVDGKFVSAFVRAVKPVARNEPRR